MSNRKKTIFIIAIYILTSEMSFALNKGKIIGQLVDSETGKPVNEEFLVIRYPSKSNGPSVSVVNRTKSDKNGGFIIDEVEPGEYFLFCQPLLKNSNYCMDKNPFTFPESRFLFKVEAGKITSVVKRVIIAGHLKILLKNQNGEKIRYKEVFGTNVNVRISIIGEALLENSIEYSHLTYNDLIDDGEAIVNLLYPGSYNLLFEFENAGYGSKYIKNVVIEKNKTTEMELKIDLNDQTGVNGFLLDKNGIPLGGIDIRVRKEVATDDFNTDANIITDKNGYYKIIGLLPGNYSLHFSKMENRVYHLGRTIKIYILQGVLLKKDLSAFF